MALTFRTGLGVAVALAVLWGAGAFGAVYAWAYWPLIVVSAGIGAIGLLRARHSTVAPSIWALATAWLAVAATILFQVMPLPPRLLAYLSPQSIEISRQFSLEYGVPHRSIASVLFSDGAMWRPLSINPAATLRGLAFVVAFGLLFLGLVRVLSLTGTGTIARSIVWIGTAVAIAGIIQKPLFNGKIYGIWTPIESAGNAFGPFVNRNHFAGWMAMALGVTAGEAIGVGHGLVRAWKDRPGKPVELLSSRGAGRMIVYGTGAIVMTMAIVFSASRSGFIACSIVLALTVGYALVRNKRRWWFAIPLVLLLAGILDQAGLDRVLARFNSGENVAMRRAAWTDTVAIIRDFPLSGSGWNTYGTATLFYQRAFVSAHLQEAHSDYLQVAAEGGSLIGFPVAILATLFLWQLLRPSVFKAQSSRDWRQIGALAGIVGFLLQETVEFSLQIPGAAVLFVVVAAIGMQSSRRLSLPATPFEKGRCHEVRVCPCFGFRSCHSVSSSRRERHVRR